MADFQIAFESTLRREDSELSGVITYDTGGVTRLGVSQKAHPEVFPEMEECSLARALEIAAQIYRQYWFCDEVNSQLVACKLFDLSVNMGTHQAIKLAQQSCGASVDGVWGPETLKAINNQDPMLMLNALKYHACQFYEALAHSDPEKYNAYLKGWENRANA